MAGAGHGVGFDGLSCGGLLRGLAALPVAAGDGAAAGAVHGFAAQLSRRAARHPHDRDAQAGAAAALPRSTSTTCCKSACWAPCWTSPSTASSWWKARGSSPWGRPTGRVRVAGMTDRGGQRGHHPPIAGNVEQAGRVGAVGPHRRHPAGHRPVPDRAGRHDQSAAIRSVARGGQDGDGDSPGPDKSTWPSISIRRR